MSTVDPTVPAHLAGLIDDAATFPPGNAPLADGARGFAARREEWYAALVASYVVKDTDLAATAKEYAATGAPEPLPASIVLTTGAGGLAPATALAERNGVRVHALEVAVRDLDDPAGNVRRIAAARDLALDEGHLPGDAGVFVELPQGDPGRGWLAAADEVAASDLRLKFRTGGVEEHLVPTTGQVAAWIDAALDRETTFKCTAGLHHAVRHTTTEGFARPVEQHGFLNILLATRRAFEGATREEVLATLEQRDGRALLADSPDPAADLAGGRRWFTSFGSCSVLEPRDDLIALGLLEDHA